VIFKPTSLLLQPNGQDGPLSAAGPYGYSPSQLRAAYGTNLITFGAVAGDGTGQTIAIIDAGSQPSLAGDLHIFDQQYGLPDPVLTQVNQRGGSALPGNVGWGLEISLDVEWAHAIAPGAKILFVGADSATDTDLDAAVRYAATTGGASVVSMSYGGNEGSYELGEDSYYATPGVTFVASSGDSGAPTIYPAASPNVLAIGGTSLFLGAGGTWSSETAWSGSGGGLSIVEPLPSYQQGLTISNGSGTVNPNGKRANPDVAYNGDPATGVSVYDSYDYGNNDPWVKVGGTSAGAPQWSALIAIADQGRALTGAPTLSGNTQTLPQLYALPAADFHDITSGTTTGTPNYTAGTGFDLTTGLGSPLANLVVAALSSFPTTPPSTPTGLAATAVAPDQIKLTWNTAAQAAGYYIERSPDGQTWTQVTTTTGFGSTLVTDGDLTPGTTYTYRLRAYNAIGNSGYSTTASTSTPSGTLNNLFADGFDSASVNPAWSFVGGTWAQSGGLMQQTSTANANPRKALVTGQSFPADVEVVSRVRLDSWTPGPDSLAGVSLYTDPTSGRGYNLVFHENSAGQKVVQFLDDFVAWGNSASFSFATGTWYWFKVEEQGGVLYGKVWADGTSEPSGWTIQQSGWTDRSSGAPGLDGGAAASGTAGNSTVSFDAFTVINPDSGSPPAAPTGVAAVANLPSEATVTWNEVGGETGYYVQRSTDNANWSQVGTTIANVTAFDDDTLTANTTYYYRVLAYNNAGSTPSSSVSVTTPDGSSVLFSDSFKGSALGPSWSTVGGTWSESGGVVQQTSTANANPRKAMVTGQTFGADVEMVSRVRLDSWTPGPYSLAGVALNNGAANGLGYNLVFHENSPGQKVIQFLDDYVAWGNSVAFSFTTGKWYWFKLEEQGGVLYGKVWADGTAEPSGWMLQQTGWTNYPAGAPGLDGGAAAAGGAGNSTVSFGDATVFNPDTGSPPSTPTGVKAVANLPSEVTVAWNEVGGETSYTIQRSTDNATWAQAGSTGAGVTTFDDDALTAGTTYYYRVIASNSSGSSAPSSSASATTPSGSGVVFSDNFNGTALGPSWSTVGGSWSESGGVAQQTSTGNANPRKALVTGQTFGPDVEIVSRVRLDSWTPGPYSLAGVSLNSSASTGLGYNLVFHENSPGQQVVQFLDDYVAWGNSVAFSFTTGKWYWFALDEQAGVLYGKVWADGTAEPSGWMLQQTGWTNYPAGAPGLDGGAAASGGAGNSTVSFGDATVFNPDISGPLAAGLASSSGRTAVAAGLSVPRVPHAATGPAVSAVPGYTNTTLRSSHAPLVSRPRSPGVGLFRLGGRRQQDDGL
jgi:hypothetical protein